MLNRIAESLYWVGRYLERAENHARLIDVYYHIRHQQISNSEVAVWKQLVEALGNQEMYLDKYKEYSEENALYFITLDRENANSFASCVSNARTNFRMVREKLPCELWDQMNGYYLWMNELQAEDIHKESPSDFYRKLREGLSTFQGIYYSTVLRNIEFHFVECGRFLERIENTIRIVQSVHATMENLDVQTSYSTLMSVLKSVGGNESFRRFHSEEVTMDAVAHFMLLNESFPRSVLFAFKELEKHLQAISEIEGLMTRKDKAQKLVGKIKNDLSWLDRKDLTQDQLGEVSRELLQSSQSLGAVIAKTFFQTGKEATA